MVDLSDNPARFSSGADWGSPSFSVDCSRVNSAVSTQHNLSFYGLVNGGEIFWASPPADFELSAGQIHVWAFSLDRSSASHAHFAASLSVDERERAGRFRFDVHRDRFIVGRGVLRGVLGRYLGITADQIQFVYGSNGKPALSKGADEIRFNLAHSRDLALLAVARNFDLGVDVELIRPIPDAAELVERFFSPSENALFQNLPEQERPVAFFNLWTRKEALLKGTGEGIACSLRSVQVSFLPGEPARLIKVEDRPGENQRWRLHDLKPAGGFSAALAFETAGPEVSCWSWPNSFDGRVEEE